MGSGHPFHTEELVQLRESQRRSLRQIPSWWLARLKFVPGQQRPDIQDGDEALAELTLRRRAEPVAALLDMDPAPGMEEAVLLFALFEHHIAGHINLNRQPGSPVDANQLHHEYDPDNVYVGTLEMDARRIEWVLLVTLADEYADDDYIDPRLATAN